MGALLLAGCSSSSRSSFSSGLSSLTKTLNTTKTQTKAVNATPNLPPVIVLKVTNVTGAVSNVTFINEAPRTKGNLTFSAVGSMDPDADGLSAIAITVQDSNRTSAPGILYSAGVFRSVTYSFHRAGPVNVPVSGLDPRGHGPTWQSHVSAAVLTSPPGPPSRLTLDHSSRPTDR